MALRSGTGQNGLKVKSCVTVFLYYEREKKDYAPGEEEKEKFNSRERKIRAVEIQRIPTSWCVDFPALFS